MNAITYISSFLLLSVLFALNAAALQWSPTPKNGEVLYACADSAVTMAWNYTLEPGDIISSTVWNFQGRSQEMVAMSAQGNFFATPSFSQRVQFVPDAGIILSHVTKGDAGNYSVTVMGLDSSGASFTLHRTVLLQVADALMTTDHELHAEQQAVAEFNIVTQQLHAILTCGQFTYTTHPPVSVEWLTPEGKTLPSTLYSGGLFKLFLPNPVTEGRYTCRISASTQNVSCSHGHGQQTSVEVNGIVTRMALMEARLAEKDAVINQLTTTQDRLQAEQQRLQAKQTEKDAVINQLTTNQQTLQAKQVEKDAVINQLTTNQQALQAKQVEKDAIINQLTTNQQTLQAKQVEKDAIINQLNTTQHRLQDQLTTTQDRLQAEQQRLQDQLNTTQDRLQDQLSTTQDRFQAEQQRLQDQLNTTQDRLQDQLTTTQDRLQAEQQRLQAENIKKDGVINALTTKVQTMEADLQTLKNHTPPAIAFSARLSINQQLGNDVSLVLSDVLLNEGDAYNSSTGRFRAPVTGTYYFSAFANARYSSHNAVLTLRSNSAARGGDLFTSWAYSDGYFQSGSLQGAVHLQRGEQVWLVSGYSGNYFVGGINTAFSGFLLFVE